MPVPSSKIMTIEEQVKAAVEEATKPIIDQFKKMVEQIKENGSSINSPVIKDERLSKEFLEAHPATNWRGVIGMRNVLVHDYYQIDEDELWNVIEKDLPPLKAQIEQYLSEMDEQ